MNEIEKEAFAKDVLKQVQDIVDVQYESYSVALNNLNKDFGVRLEETLPRLLKTCAPKIERWWPIFLAIINGVSIGCCVYAAIAIS